MNECEKKGCSLCQTRREIDKDGHVKSLHGHPDVTDVKNRELGLFLLVLVIMIFMAIVMASLYYRATDSNSTRSETPVAMVHESR